MNTKKTINLLMILMLSVFVTSCGSDDNNTSDPVEENNPPTSFNLNEITNEATDIDILPVFNWETANDPDGDTVVYDMYLGTEQAATNLYVANLTTTSFNVTNQLNFSETYYWRVVAKDNQGGETSSTVYSFTTKPEENNTVSIVDDFDGTGPLIDYVTNNAEVLPNVGRVSGRYHALLDDNTNNQTLHFNQEQGRLDAKLMTFPFEVIARNIGIGITTDSQTAPSHNGTQYNFAGIQVHAEDFNSINSSHIVVGHRGTRQFTIEGKNTVDGVSTVDDAGIDTAPLGRVDIRIVGDENNELTFYWQQPNLNSNSTPDEWVLYRSTGKLPGTEPSYDNQVYVGLITYAFGNAGIPFVGTCDAIEFNNL
ncbi:hypothetical protein [Aquimarina sp. AU119]|uniref:hypothetical protein n=1 Tax=Aquimarina sp. AU119 TaxID=2108528 RepID=UPI001356D42B|nr:hypothetical protein [Aquimarina sp. AU119]